MRVTLRATNPCQNPPAWAFMERALLAAIDQAARVYLERYTEPDGSLKWPDRWHSNGVSRDGIDDFYEAFVNWPLYYLLGGGDEILGLAEREWEAITRQLTRIGVLQREYEPGYDQFHQSEHTTYFYNICLADPDNARMRERALRFAGFYTGADPQAQNYDPVHKIIRAAHNGSLGPRWGYFDGEPAYGWSQSMRPYGLPYDDVPGIRDYEDLKDPALARRMGAVMQERMGKGDAATNLMVTSLVLNAFLLTGDPQYSAWILEYTGAWVERARQNGGLLPDSVGLTGQVGEYLGGRWYGGLYGWTWPHGYYNIAMASAVAGGNAFLLSGDEFWLDLPRTQMDRVMAMGKILPLSEIGPTLAHHWYGQTKDLPEEARTLLVPYRYRDSGWFDYQCMSPIYPAMVWNLSQQPADWERIERIRTWEPYDWRRVLSFHTKEESGHEQPWLRYLVGDNPGYPEAILAASYEQVCRRLELIRTDPSDFYHKEQLTTADIHHWQNHNPVMTEALVQLTLGAPQPLYNGGLLFSPLRYFDLEKKRPGLPADVAALVESVEAEAVRLTLVNLSPLAGRRLALQAGAFGEHQFLTVQMDRRSSDFPGRPQDYAAPDLQTELVTVEVQASSFTVELPPATRVTLSIAMKRFVHTPSYRQPDEVR